MYTVGAGLVVTVGVGVVTLIVRNCCQTGKSDKARAKDAGLGSETETKKPIAGRKMENKNAVNVGAIEIEALQNLFIYGLKSFASDEKIASLTLTHLKATGFREVKTNDNVLYLKEILSAITKIDVNKHSNARNAASQATTYIQNIIATKKLDTAELRKALVEELVGYVNKNSGKISDGGSRPDAERLKGQSLNDSIKILESLQVNYKDELTKEQADVISKCLKGFEWGKAGSGQESKEPTAVEKKAFMEKYINSPVDSDSKEKEEDEIFSLRIPTLGKPDKGRAKNEVKIDLKQYNQLVGLFNYHSKGSWSNALEAKNVNTTHLEAIGSAYHSNLSSEDQKIAYLKVMLPGITEFHLNSADDALSVANSLAGQIVTWVSFSNLDSIKLRKVVVDVLIGYLNANSGNIVNGFSNSQEDILKKEGLECSLKVLGNFENKYDKELTDEQKSLIEKGFECIRRKASK